MSDPFDDARRSLEGVPAPDLWAEVERRAATDGPVRLRVGGAPDGRRWLLAAAAVAAIAVIGAAALAWTDEEGTRVDTTPATEAPTTTTAPEPPTIVLDAVGGDDEYEDGVCWVGVTGDPVVMEAGPADPPLFEYGSPDPGQLVLHDKTGGLLVELSLPGEAVLDLMGDDVEDIEVSRGPAHLWITDEFAQVRWFPDGSVNDPCGSFTVTVAGGTPAEERATAVDYADRILLSTDDG